MMFSTARDRSFSFLRWLRLRSSATLVLLAQVILLASSPSSSSATEWRYPVVDLGTGYNPRLSVTDSQPAAAIWQTNTNVYSALDIGDRPIFSGPFKMPSTGKYSSWSGRIAVAPDGEVNAVWVSGSQWINGTHYLDWATRDAGAESFIKNIHLDQGRAFTPEIAVGDYGAIAIAWVGGYEPNQSIRVFASVPDGSNAVISQTVSLPRDQMTAPEVALAEDGTTTVAWRAGSGAGSMELHTATRGPGQQSFDQVRSIASDVLSQQMTTGPNSETAIVWNTAGGRLGLATRRSANDFSVSGLVASSGEILDPQLAVGPTGDVTVVWHLQTETQDLVQTATRPSGQSTFGPTQTLVSVPRAINRLEPKVAYADDGTAIAVWARGEGGRVQSATRSPESSLFGSTETLSTASVPTGSPQIGIGSDGAATVVWGLQAPGVGSSDQKVQALKSEPITYPLNVYKQGQGSGIVQSVAQGVDCGPTCSSEFSLGEEVTLVADPDPGSYFTEWGGACESGGVAPPEPPPWTCQVEVGGIRNVTASFEPPVPLSVVLQGDGRGRVGSIAAGIDCGAVCSSGVAPGSEVTFFAAPESGSRFQGWGGACAGIGRQPPWSGPWTCTTTIERSSTVTAEFLSNSIPDDATLAVSSVSGPAIIRRGRTAVYLVALKNLGRKSATGVVIRATGSGASGLAGKGFVTGLSSATWQIPIRAQKAGRVSVTFTISSANAPPVSVKKAIRVK
jgi:hypothetical protein